MTKLIKFSVLFLLLVSVGCTSSKTDSKDVRSPVKKPSPSSSTSRAKAVSPYKRMEPQRTAEELSWDRTRATNTLEAYRSFVGAYPYSRFYLEGVSNIIRLEKENLRNIVKAHDEGPIKELMTKLLSTDPVERFSAVVEAGKLGETGHPTIPFLIALLDDFSQVQYRHGNLTVTVAVREEAVEALAKIGKPAVGLLVETLGNSFFSCYSDNRSIYYYGDWMREGTSKVLVKIGDVSVQPLIGLVDNKYRPVRLTAEEALKELTGQDFGTDRPAWQKWWTENDRGL